MSQKKILRWVIHCTATPQGREVTKVDIDIWHLGPCDNPDGTVTYKGIIYPNRNALPNEKIHGFDIKKLHGRGWRVRGYHKIYHLNGSTTILTPNNLDEFIDPWEITNGASGFNQTSIHVVFAGGLTPDAKKPMDTRTPEQNEEMAKDAIEIKKRFPWVEIEGHNNLAKKDCPCFDVPAWFKSINK
jgi:N-acetylmuramoyl-L-alanine amidase